MQVIRSKYKKVADHCYYLFKSAGIPLYNSKYSNKIYTNYQKLFCLIYKQYRKFTYEDLLNDLADNETLRKYVGFKKLPNYTTLIKFAKKITKLINRLIFAFRMLISEPKKIAIDATGISLDNASPHYCKRVSKTYKKRPFMKATFIVDIEKYIILIYKLRKKPRHDTKDAEPLLRKLSKKKYKPEILYADRGYDSNKIFKQCFEELEAYPLILQRNVLLPKHKKEGTYRKLTCDVFDYGEYLQRNKIETCNSMLKRRFGHSVKSRINITQKTEIALRIIAYNIDRILRTTTQATEILIKLIRVS